MDKLAILTTFIHNIVVFNIPLLYGTVGEIVVEKSGSLNLGVEGIMAVGAIFGYIIGCYAKGEKIGADWCGGIAEGSVVLTGVNQDVAAKGTVDELKKVVASIEDGSLKIFDTKNFTVEGKALDSYKADVDTDKDFKPDTEVVADGYFHESEKRSAPCFDVRIDGITLLNEKF